MTKSAIHQMSHSKTALSNSRSPHPSPQAVSPAHANILALQQSVGNQAVDRLLRSPNPAAGSSAPSQLNEGQPLAPSVRAEMESRFGQDFSQVRVHTDAKAADLAQMASAKAYTIQREIVFAKGKYAPETISGKRLLAHELAHVVQQRQTAGTSATAAVAEAEAAIAGRQAAAGEPVSIQSGAAIGIQREPEKLKAGIGKAAKKLATKAKNAADKKELLDSFAEKFPDAAELIRKNPEAMKLIDEAKAAGAEFGGYAEDGPGKRAWAYTAGKKVYVPKAQTDKILAMKSFLFELNNAIRAPKFAELHEAAAKGTKGTLDAKQYAYKTVEQEVEGVLRMGEIWVKTKKQMGGDKELDKYDRKFWLSDYKAFKEGKKTKDDIIKSILKRVRGHEPHPEWTVEEYYMDAYKRLSGGK